jgi:hypothetical protein
VFSIELKISHVGHIGGIGEIFLDVEIQILALVLGVAAKLDFWSFTFSSCLCRVTAIKAAYIDIFLICLSVDSLPDCWLSSSLLRDWVPLALDIKLLELLIFL